MMQLRILQAATTELLEEKTNTFLERDIVLHVVRMQVYPLDDGGWICYIMYKKRDPNFNKTKAVA